MSTTVIDNEPEVCTDGSGVDSFGDGCSWYTDKATSMKTASLCGMFDTDHFKANEQCCACKEEESWIEEDDVTTQCVDSGVPDAYGDDCSYYAETT